MAAQAPSRWKTPSSSSSLAEELERPDPAGPYFANRPSASGGKSAAASNQGLANPAWRTDVSARVRAAIDAGATSPVPVDLVTASGSGVDPHLSPAAAKAQIPRVAKAAGVSAAVVEAIINDAVEEPLWGRIGQARVNVLRLNVAIAALSAPTAAAPTPTPSPATPTPEESRP